MAPEYRIYIPPQSIVDFESALGRIEGAAIISKKTAGNDFPITREDLKLDELTQAVKSTLQQVPQETRLNELTTWGWSDRNKKKFDIQTPQEWLQLMMILKPHEKGLVTGSFHRLAYVLEQELGWQNSEQINLANARNLDPSRLYTRGLGEKGRKFLCQILTK